MHELTDKELLELAAKAAGLQIEFTDEFGFDVSLNGYWPNGRDKHGDVDEWWNPIVDDGDALRLAVKLNIRFHEWDDLAMAEWCDKAPWDKATKEESQDDPYAATRRAIVRAAAEIGKAMP